MDWAAIYAEGKNKIRWAIMTTLQHGGVPLALDFQDGMEIGGRVMDEVLAEVKILLEKPDYAPTWSRSRRGSFRESFRASKEASSAPFGAVEDYLRGVGGMAELERSQVEKVNGNGTGKKQR